MLSRVERTIREQRLLAPGDRVLCAVSGGPDSMALMHALWELRDRWRLTLEVATIDHGLRAAARAEVELVAARAADLGLRCHLVTVDVRGAHLAARSRRSERVARSTGKPRSPRPDAGASWQDVARQLRLAALLQLADDRGAGKVALAHQADDQAETILFRILRGTGVRGLAGIPYQRERLVRPLLDVDRGQILAYLRRRSIPFVEDPSNADPRFARARLRHQVLPALRAENPRLDEALRALAADAARVRAGDASDLLDPLPSLNRRAARVVERLRRAPGGTRRVDVAGGQVEICYGNLTWRPAAPAPGETGAAAAEPPALTISAPGDYGWEGGPRLAVREGEPVDGAASFDAELVGRPLRLRRLRPGDRMRPRGGRGSRKLSDLLIDAKIARPLRPRLPVLTTADDEILFVPGLRPAETGRPRAATRRWLSVFSASTRPEPNRDDPETSV
jgi:tRNA(Ile)-lysidine synthase